MAYSRVLAVKAVQARIKHGTQFSFYGASVSGEIEHRDVNGGVISSNWKVQEDKEGSLICSA